MEKHALISIRPALSSKRHAQSGCECFVDCLSRYLSLPDGGKANMITVTKAPDCCSKMSGCKMTHEQTSHHASMRARIAAPQLLHRFVLDADSFLPDLRKILYSAF